MTSLESFQLLPIPEQVFVPSNGIGPPVNLFFPSHPPLLHCLPPTPYTFLPGAPPFPFYSDQEIHPIYDQREQDFFCYSEEFANGFDNSNETKPESAESGDDGESSGAAGHSAQTIPLFQWAEQLKFILRDIYRFCDSEESVADCKAVLEILGNSNTDFFNLHSKLTALHEKVVARSDSESPHFHSGSLSEQGLTPNHSVLLHTPTRSLPANSIASLLTASCSNSPFSEEYIDSKTESMTPRPRSNSSPVLSPSDSPLAQARSEDSYEDELGLESSYSPDFAEEFDKTNVINKVVEEVLPIVDPPQQLWSQVIQRKLSHNSSRGVSPTPGYPGSRNRQNAYTTTSNQRIELGPGGLSTIYPSNVDPKIDQQSQSRVMQLQKKLASSNKKRQEEPRKSLDERLAKANQERNKKREEITDKMRLKHTKVREIQASKDEERRQKRLNMQLKLEGANDRRNNHIEEVKRKAQDEEEKVNCIHLINQIESDNRKLELHAELKRKQEYVTVKKKEMAMSKKQQNEQRIQSYNERKVQKQAEQEARLAQLAQQRRARDVRQRERREMQEKARQEEALSKDLTRKKAVRKYSMPEGRSFPKIKQASNKKKTHKSEDPTISNDTQALHDIPEDYPYPTPKICKICNTRLDSELYLLAHFRSSRHHEALENIENCEEKRFKLGDRWFIEELDASEDTKSLSVELQGIQKSDKKKAKKLKLKLETNFPKVKPSFDFTSLRSHSAIKSSFSKIFPTLSRILSSQNKHLDKITSIEEVIQQIREVKSAVQINTKNEAILYFIQSDGLGIYGQILALISVHIENHYDKITPNFWGVVQAIIDTICIVSQQSKINCTYIAANSSYIICIDIFLLLMRLWVARWGSHMLYYYQMQSPSHHKMKKDFEYVGVTESLLSLFNFIIATMNGVSGINHSTEPLLHEVCIDLINYALSIGLMDQIFVIFNVVCGPMENTDTESIVLKSMEVLAIVTRHLKKGCRIMLPRKKQSEFPHTTIFSSKLKQFPSMNVTSLLYSIILHSGPPKPLNAPPPKLSDNTVTIATIAFQFINNAFLINHSVMQGGVGSDETRVNEFKLLVSYLIGYSKHYENRDLLNLLILSVGYFVLFSVQNQDAIQAGRLPTILQHLVDLPFAYFSSMEQKNILFPSLIAATYDNENNRESLKKDVSLKMFTVYINQQLGNTPPSNSLAFNQFDLKWRFPLETIDSVFEFYGISK